MKNIAHNFATKVILVPIGFISSVLIANYLGSDGRGVFGFIILISSIFYPLLSLGFDAGAVFNISKNKFTFDNTYFTVFAYALTCGLVYALIIIAAYFFQFLGKIGNELSSYLLLLVVTLILLSTIMTFTIKVLQANNEFIFTNKLLLLEKILNPLFIIGFIVIFANDVWGAILASTLVMFIVFLLCIIHIRQKHSVNISTNSSFFRESISYGIKGWIGNIAVAANNRADQLIIGFYFPSKFLGVYGISVLLSELLWIPLNSINPVVHNMVASKYYQNPDFSFFEVDQIHRLILFFSFVGLILFIPVSYFIIQYVFSSEYNHAFIPFCYLLPGTLALISLKLLIKVFSATNHIFFTTKIQVVIMIASALFYIFLIPKYQLNGAAAGTSLAYITGTIYAISLYLKTYKKKLQELFLINKQDLIFLKEKVLNFKNQI